MAVEVVVVIAVVVVVVAAVIVVVVVAVVVVVSVCPSFRSLSLCSLTFLSTILPPCQPLFP